MRPIALFVVVSCALASAGCNCGRNVQVISVKDAGHPYDRVLPDSALAAGATKAKSEHFELVGDVTAPAGSTSRSEHFQLRDGVVGATQEHQ